MRGGNCGVNTFVSNDFDLDASNPALYRSEYVNGFCHGDDFVTAAAEDQLEIFGRPLHEKFDTGAAEHLDKEMEALHRTVRVSTDELIMLKTDQKYVPLLLKDLEAILSRLQERN